MQQRIKVKNSTTTLEAFAEVQRLALIELPLQNIDNLSPC